MLDYVVSPVQCPPCSHVIACVCFYLCVDAFKVICRIDGSSKGNLNPSKLKDSQHLEDEVGNPLFGIKGNLVRFLGNLAHRCPANQTLIADLDGLHLILSHFQVDHLNPCIHLCQYFTGSDVM